MEVIDGEDVVHRAHLDALLDWLDSDREKAAVEYESLRRKLITFFEGRRCGLVADQLADRAFEIVATKLHSEGEKPRVSPASYFFGVARNLAYEEWRRQKRTEPIDGKTEMRLARQTSAPEAVKQRALLERLKACLERLSRANQMLICDYYWGEKREKILNRRRMAERLSITTNALNIRAHRLRAELEACIRNGVTEKSSPGE
jgi:RNA polymerase sigma factor (sigma-70 family)